MIEGLIERVSQGEAAAGEAPAVEEAPAAPAAPEVMIAADFFDTTAVLTPNDAPLTITTRAARAQEVFREVAHVKEEPPEPVAKPPPARSATPAPGPRPAAPATHAASHMISDDMLAAFTPPGGKEGASPPDAQKTQRMPPINPRFFTPVGGRRPEGKQPEGADKTVKLDAPPLQGKDRPTDK